ncbi:hypothetical protein J7L48_10765 [bacterium]|nr:hypothetical protein [bacterium]
MIIIGTLIYKYLYFVIKKIIGIETSPIVMSNAMWNVLLMRVVEFTLLTLASVAFYKSISSMSNILTNYIHLMLLATIYFIVDLILVFILKPKKPIIKNIMVVYFLTLFTFLYGYILYFGAIKGYYFPVGVLTITILIFSTLLFFLSNDIFKIRMNNTIIQTLNNIKLEGFKTQSPTEFLENVGLLMKKTEVFSSYMIINEKYGNKTILYHCEEIGIERELFDKHKMDYILMKYFPKPYFTFALNSGKETFHFVYTIISPIFNVDIIVKNISFDIFNIYSLLKTSKDYIEISQKFKEQLKEKNKMFNEIQEGINQILTNSANNLTNMFYYNDLVKKGGNLTKKETTKQFTKEIVLLQNRAIRLEYIKNLINNETFHFLKNKIDIVKIMRETVGMFYNDKISLNRKAVFFNISERFFVFIITHIISFITKFGGRVSKINLENIDSILHIQVYNDKFENISQLYDNKLLDSKIFESLTFSQEFNSIDLQLFKRSDRSCI